MKISVQLKVCASLQQAPCRCGSHQGQLAALLHPRVAPQRQTKLGLQNKAVYVLTQALNIQFESNFHFVTKLGLESYILKYT